MTFLTYAAHWLDDQFDPSSQRLSDAARQHQFQEWAPEGFLESDGRLKQLLGRMQKAVPGRSKAEVERAFKRIIYGGLIQNAASPERRSRLLEGYLACVKVGLPAGLVGKYNEIYERDEILAWITTKVVIELLDCCAPSYSRETAEFYNLLYGPILYYHDIEREISLERFGLAFGGDPKQKLPKAPDLLWIVDEVCKELASGILRSQVLPAPRQKQLQYLRDVYKQAIPTDLFAAYDRYLSTQALGPSATSLNT